MTRSRDEKAAEMVAEEADARHAALADAVVAAGEYGTLPDVWMEYEDWLELTGLDDSFVGDGVTVPGTSFIYEAEMRAVEEARIKTAAAIEMEGDMLVPGAAARLTTLFREAFDWSGTNGLEDIERPTLRAYAQAHPQVFDTAAEDWDKSLDAGIAPD